MCKRIGSSQWTRIILSFLTFAECFKFPNLFFLFLFILKCFQKVFKTFLGFFTVWYEMFTTTLQQLRFQWAAQSMTFSISLVKSRQQVWSKCCHFPHSITPFPLGKWASGTYFLPYSYTTEVALAKRKKSRVVKKATSNCTKENLYFVFIYT